MSEVEVWLGPRAELAEVRGWLLGPRTVSRSDYGKPLVDDLFFSVSDSGEQSALAWCRDVPVGVDLEAPRVVRRGASLAARLCSARELAWLDAQGSAGFERALLGLWVRKEAVAKADGRGIGWLLQAPVDVMDPVVVGRWLVRDLPEPTPGYQAAVAWALDRR